ncbi:glycosyltransferase family 2 protein [Nakamurella antarctica]|uniref:Glycosyltransferase family 2 protein n=1 Tax=Nakamurella antarctica TaxID=1902245 RepID=A0A3G8ZVL9_9ACTN|nr:glycosyltransferase family 2 protein [Nakamurella antarctica]AZI58514.1 glycosyltransferase family 2 protein [Nakamurella antarctica]
MRAVEEPIITPTVSVVVLAWLDEPWLQRSVRAILDSKGVVADVILVDNGCTSQDVVEIGAWDGVLVVRPNTNLGFAGGCNYGLSFASGAYVALVNSDAVVEQTALAKLVHMVLPGTDELDSVAVAGGSIRLSEDPSLLNSAGNPVHVLGLSWAGDMGQPEVRTDPIDVAVASGACVVMTRAWWETLGGFDDAYFAYHEDAELSIRTWRRGRRVVYVPDAVAIHRYEFSRNEHKMYLIERNRLMLVSTAWSIRALILLSPALITLELALTLFSLKQRWFGAKLRGWEWLWTNRSHLRDRRRVLRDELAVTGPTWMSRLTPELAENGSVALPPGAGLVNFVMRWYWNLVKRLV